MDRRRWGRGDRPLRKVPKAALRPAWLPRPTGAVAKARARTTQAAKLSDGELGRHRVVRRRRVQVGHDEKPLPVREGSFDPGTVLDASTRRARFLVGEPIAIGDDHRSRRAQSRFDAMAHRLRVRLAAIAQIRRGRVEQAKVDLRKLGGGEDGRSVRDRRTDRGYRAMRPPGPEAAAETAPRPWEAPAGARSRSRGVRWSPPVEG